MAQTVTARPAPSGPSSWRPLRWLLCRCRGHDTLVALNPRGVLVCYCRRCGSVEFV